MQEIWNELFSFEYSYEILIGIGVLLVLVGFFKIVRNGLRIILWIVLTAVGCWGVAYGLERSSNPVMVNVSEDLGSLIKPGRELIVDQLLKVCRNMDVPYLKLDQ